jgi:hypothetical protein
MDRNARLRATNAITAALVPTRYRGTRAAASSCGVPFEVFDDGLPDQLRRRGGLAGLDAVGDLDANGFG